MHSVLAHSIHDHHRRPQCKYAMQQIKRKQSIQSNISVRQYNKMRCLPIDMRFGFAYDHTRSSSGSALFLALSSSSIHLSHRSLPSFLPVRLIYGPPRGLDCAVDSPTAQISVLGKKLIFFPCFSGNESSCTQKH